MRDIKFRVWEEGFRMFYINEKSDYTLTFGDPLPYLEIHCSDGVMDGFAVNNVMQYTGLKDKNGKDIYEGDLLHEKYRWEVMYYKDGFIIKDLGKNGFNFNSLYQLISHRDKAGIPIEVVGNIYENKDLT